MGATYAQDLRDRVLSAYDRGMKTRQIADTFQVSPAWARRVKQRRRETGQTTPRPKGGATVVKIDERRLRDLVRAQPDATLRELGERLGVTCGESTICMALKRLKFSFKKDAPCGRAGPARRRPPALRLEDAAATKSRPSLDLHR